jgi:hypothetical protein
MKKKQVNFPNVKKQIKMTWLFLFLGVFSINAQLNRKEEKSEIFISYGNTVLPEQIDLHKDDLFSWQILDESSRIIANENTGSLFSYLFLVPGTYEIQITNVQLEQSHDCSNHGFAGSWKVNVSPVNISFDIESIVFSAPLQVSNLAKSIEVFVPVTVSFYANSVSEIAVDNIKLNFQGVDCAVKSSYRNPTEKLSAGRSLLHFIASGSALKGSYIMLDFVDQNGRITTYYHTKEL